MVSIPKAFKARILKLYSQDGGNWLNALPGLRDTLLEYWNLENTSPVSQLSYNYLEYAHSPEYGPVVVKIGFPNRELCTEIQALQVYQGLGGAVRLLDSDLDRGALLLERINPGYNLTSVSNDEEATRIAAQAMVDLRQPAPNQDFFPSMGDWCDGFNRYQHQYSDGSGPLKESLVNRAAGLARDLLETPANQVLLHGDLHHGNLLYREDGSWIVIDPKGVTGDFASEVGPYLFNPVPDLIHSTNLPGVLNRRLRILEEVTSVDRQRLEAWSFCRSVLSAIWTVEDGDNYLPYWVEISEIFGRLVK